MLFPSLCFTVTLLHTNSFLHNASPTDVHSVLEYLIKCELLECVQRGIKTSRRSTSVYIKRLPMCDHNGQIDVELKLIFDEKFDEFKCYRPDFTIDEYLKKNMRINLDAIGIVTDELIRYLLLPEYMNIKLDPLYNLKETDG